MTFSLFLLMGVSWLMEIISFWVGGSAYIWIPTDVINISTGILIFIVFILKPKVLKLLKIKCPCLKRLDPFCPSFFLEESSNHYRGKRRSFFPHRQRPKMCNNQNSAESNNSGQSNSSSSTDFTQTNSE